MKNESGNIYFSAASIAGIHFTAVASHKGITHLKINMHDDKLVSGAIKLHDDDPYLYNIFDQLAEYFELKRNKFVVPLDLIGTDFQLKVWHELRKISYGHTISYKTLAEKIGDLKAVRAVGHANSMNPVPIIVPCHRVINTNGTLGGFSCGVDIKEKLLEVEGCLQPDLFH
jgi:methylated-DNA-[protein]-cysteine S-methyltransferase